TEYRELAEAEQQARTAWLEVLRDQFSPTLSLAQAEVIMDLAWQEGHSCGYEQVEHLYSDYADMVARVIALDCPHPLAAHAPPALTEGPPRNFGCGAFAVPLEVPPRTD